MTAAEMLTELSASGIELSLDGQALRFRARKGALTGDLRRQIAEQRDRLIRHLQASSPSNPSGTRQKCHPCDMRNWVDERPKNGRIRTHCGRCGRFIGYRPEYLGSRSGKVA